MYKRQDLLRELDVDPEIAQVVLGTRAATFTPVEVAGQALIRASVTLTLRIVRPASNFTSSLATATEVGAGFDEAGAATLATENALKKLARQLGR